MRKYDTLCEEKEEHPTRQRDITQPVLLTLNLFRWLSGTVSLSGQLQQLPMASSEDHVSTT